MNSVWARCPKIVVMYVHGMYMNILVYTKICMYVHAYLGSTCDIHVCTVLPNHVQVVRIPYGILGLAEPPQRSFLSSQRPFGDCTLRVLN